jgi:L-ascorbate metabolism protein UlaG (beta-lactamase superfamily)
VLVFLVAVVFIIAAAAYGVLSHPMFGRQPAGARLERIGASPNYINGVFVNRVPKPGMAKGVSTPRLAWDYFFKKRARPAAPLPSQKTDFSRLPPERDVLVWFGHSSLFLRINGRTFLVDPNFSSYASPFWWKTKSFAGTDVYSAPDMPEIDILLLTHNHYDHLNLETIRDLKDGGAKVICGLGVGETLEYWGVPADAITETDWDETLELGGGTKLHVLTAHHFSGRSLWDRDKTLWVSYLLETPTFKLLLGGDSGYGTHFADIGKRFGPIDLALLENGQYDANWPYNHMQPEETMQAAADVGAKHLLPIHAGRFILANHPWDEPYRRIAALSENSPIKLLTPIIGEPVYLDTMDRTYRHWWEGIGSVE